MLKKRNKIFVEEQKVQTVQKLQTSHRKVIGMHAHDLPMWQLLLLHVRGVVIKNGHPSMQCAQSFELYAGYQVGNRTQANVLLNYCAVFSQVFVFLLAFSQTAHASSVSLQYCLLLAGLPDNHRAVFNSRTYFIQPTYLSGHTGCTSFAPQLSMSRRRLHDNQMDLLKIWLMCAHFQRIAFIPIFCRRYHV